MTDRTAAILVIDDEENMRHMLSAMLSRQGYEVTTAAEGRMGLERMSESEYDFILCDIKMPGMDGMAFLKKSRSLDHGATIIMMSAFGNIDLAIDAMKLGAYDYISKPFKNDEVLLTLKKAQEREQLLRENRHLKQQVKNLEGPLRYGKMIAASRAMREVIEQADRVAGYDTTVLVTGESGTGKELMTHAIHSRSQRCRGPFVAVNCGGIPENLLESELFGYTRGAFTGADRNKKGLFATANGGTLFLDEIGELPILLQVKLLRALQEKEIQPVGAEKPVKIDARIITATAKDLEREVRNGHFREDLFYRLNVICLTMPPLRERSEDILPLCAHFLKGMNTRLGMAVEGISEEVQRAFMTWHWPGNVRELEHALEHALVMAGEGQVLPEHLPEQFRRSSPSDPISIKKAQKILERRLIGRALAATGGNKSQASEMLEISYPSLLDKIKKYQIELPQPL